MSIISIFFFSGLLSISLGGRGRIVDDYSFIRYYCEVIEHETNPDTTILNVIHSSTEDECYSQTDDDGELIIRDGTCYPEEDGVGERLAHIVSCDSANNDTSAEMTELCSWADIHDTHESVPIAMDKCVRYNDTYSFIYQCSGNDTVNIITFEDNGDCTGNYTMSDYADSEYGAAFSCNDGGEYCDTAIIQYDIPDCEVSTDFMEFPIVINYCADYRYINITTTTSTSAPMNVTTYTTDSGDGAVFYNNILFGMIPFLSTIYIVLFI